MCQRGDAELLGNENHIVLALENIINNAQFFAGRRKGSRPEKNARIAVEVESEGAYVRYRVYNRGPHIDTETAAKLFQLGFSTRRQKEHHGKGLGLYFVHEIIKGYDGSVHFINVENRPDVLSLRLAMANGEVITDVIELLVVDGKPLCRRTGSEEAVTELEWQLADELASIEITHQSDQKTYPFKGEVITNGGDLLDPTQPAYPRWLLSNAFAGRRLQFRPLDIAGVEFQLRLPTMAARLEGDLLGADEQAMADQVDTIASQFRVLEE